MPANKRKQKDIARIFEEGTLIDEALRSAFRDAVLRHKQAGLPVAFWQNGKTVWVPAEQIEVDAPVAGKKGKTTRRRRRKVVR